MYYLTVEDKFSSAHQLRGYKGKCENLHGHNFKVKVCVKGDSLNGIGLLIDFHEIKAHLKEVLAILDHKNLNELELFSETNPSSENIARFIFEQMENLLSTESSVLVDSASVFESETSSCTYRKE